MQKIYPFKFLDAYKREDIDFFFGREEEIEILYKMIFQTNILVVYGASGVGKTSLIQCGLANKFQTYDWLALDIRRGENMMASLDKTLCEESDDVFVYEKNDKSIQKGEAPIKDLAQKIEAVYEASFKPIYLIFDQFEEIYTVGDKLEQQQFIRVIQQLLDIEQPIKIILSIREEYLGHLYDFERKVPELLRKKLRIEPMGLNKVENIIKKVGDFPKGNIRLKAGEEELIAKGIFEKIRGKETKRTIELPYLQVFLDKLYLQITDDEERQADAIFSLEELGKMGGIDDVLQDFLEVQILNIAKKLDQPAAALWKILSPFVTLDGTKFPLSQKMLLNLLSDDIDDGFVQKSLEAFVESRILRYTDEQQVYEIAHDALAKQIHTKRSGEEVAIMEAQRLVKSNYNANEDVRAFLTKNQLGFVEDYLPKLSLSNEEKEYVEESKKEVKYQRNKLRRRLQLTFSGIFVAFLIMGGLVYWAIGEKKDAEIALETIELNKIKKVAEELYNYGKSYSKIDKKGAATELYKIALDTLRDYKEDDLYKKIAKEINK